MRKRVVPTIILLLCAAAAYGVQTEWVQFNSPEGRFSILLPGQPKAEQDIDPDIKELITYRYSVYAPRSSFLCTYSDFSSIGKDLDAFLNSASEGIVRGAKATKVSEQKISFDGYPGRELTLKLPGKPEVSARTRIYVVGTRLYSLTHVHLNDLDSKLIAEDSRRFFSSFKLLPK